MMDFAIEEMSLGAWPALQTVVFDGWLLRFAEGYTKRSNSVNPLYASTLPLAEKIEACEELYASRGLPTVFKITAAESQAPIDEALAARGYARMDETRVMALDLAAGTPPRAAAPRTAAPREAAPVPAGAADGARAAVSLADSFSGEWIDAFCACGRHEAERGVIERILGNVVAPTAVASVREEGVIVGCGYGALDRGWVGLFDIAVREDCRRRGHGEATVSAILDRARELGAARAYLQVVAGNAPAERLYEGLGFREEYRYWYRRRA
jgi:N-acetylglutamate synthase